MFAYGLNISAAFELPSFYAWYYVFNNLLSARQFYVSVFFLTGLLVLGMIFVQGLMRLSFYSNRHILQEMNGHDVNVHAKSAGKPTSQQAESIDTSQDVFAEDAIPENEVSAAEFVTRST